MRSSSRYPTFGAPFPDFHSHIEEAKAKPGVMAIAAGKPPQMSPGETKGFVALVTVSLRVGPTGGPGYVVFVQVDPANLISENDENNNIQGFNFISKSFCQ